MLLFATEQLVAVTSGPQSSTCGKQIRVAAASASNGHVEVTIVAYSGNAGGQPCMQIKAHPTHVVAFSSRDPIVFVEKMQEGPAPPYR